MATYAVCRSGVIKFSARPGVDRMAILTTITAGNMVSGFSCGVEATVMAATAVAAAVRVGPEACVTKVSWAVAILTDIVCWNMIAALARCLRAIVATDTVVFDAAMIKRRGLPAAGCVTAFTVITGRWVVALLTKRDLVVMAGYAAAGDFIVVDFGYIGPAAWAVAALTVVATVDMVAGLGGCRNDTGRGVA